jgi:hypothetical protein
MIFGFCFNQLVDKGVRKLFRVDRASLGETVSGLMKVT